MLAILQYRRINLARISELPENQAAVISAMETDAFQAQPYVSGPALSERRVAIVTTAGLHLRDQPRFRMGDRSYRQLDGDISGDDFVMSQGSVGFDRTGFQRDANTLFPLDRLRELAAAGVVGSVASAHYSVSSAFSDPREFESVAAELAERLRQDNVDATILIPA